MTGLVVQGYIFYYLSLLMRATSNTHDSTGVILLAVYCFGLAEWKTKCM